PISDIFSAPVSSIFCKATFRISSSESISGRYELIISSSAFSESTKSLRPPVSDCLIDSLRCLAAFISTSMVCSSESEASPSLRSLISRSSNCALSERNTCSRFCCLFFIACLRSAMIWSLSAIILSPLLVIYCSKLQKKSSTRSKRMQLLTYIKKNLFFVLFDKVLHIVLINDRFFVPELIIRSFLGNDYLCHSGIIVTFGRSVGSKCLFFSHNIVFRYLISL